MTRRLLSSGSAFEKQWGYSRGVVQGPWVFMSGTLGYDYATKSIPDDIGEQTRIAWASIRRFLAEADAGLSDIVRVTYYVTRGMPLEPVLAVCGEVLRDIRPASTMVVIDSLALPEAKIEIEVTALKST